MKYEDVHVFRQIYKLEKSVAAKNLQSDSLSHISNGMGYFYIYIYESENNTHKHGFSIDLQLRIKHTYSDLLNLVVQALGGTVYYYLFINLYKSEIDILYLI